jgi:23S rRNA (uracil1939-C5)-methyltransferase
MLGSAALDAIARFATEAQLVPELAPACEPRGYRLRARLAVRGRIGSPKLGIFQQDSHRIVDIPSCLVQHPLINDVAAALKLAMRDTRMEPYAEAPHRGLVRYLQVVVERATQTAQVVVVANSEERAPLEPLLTRFSALLASRLHSLFISPQTARSNVILGPRCEKVLGPDAVQERICGADVYFPPDAFGQSHLALYEKIVERIATWVPDGSDLVELYAGTGAIGLSLLPRCVRVRFNEQAAGSLHGLRMGIDGLSPVLRSRAELHAGPVAAHAELAAGAQLVIADPPRKGLDPALLSALCATPPARFVYLSCGLDSYLSDARALLREGRFHLAQLVVYDLFPFTEHVEVLSCFDRVA